MPTFKDWIAGRTAEATPADSDEFFIRDDSGNVSKRITWSGVKSALGLSGGVTAFAGTLLDDADAAAARTTLGVAPLASPTFTGNVVVPNADADAEALNRITADGRYLSISPAVDLPGAAGNYISTPDVAALDITGDIEVTARVALDDWTPAATNAITAKANDGGSQLSWWVAVFSSGGAKLLWRWSTDGSTINTVTSDPITVTDGATLWVRVTMDVDNGAGGYVVRFYTAADQVSEPSSWTKLGADVVGGTTTSIFSGTAIQEIGSRNSGVNDLLAGNVYRVVIRNGIAGTVVADYRPVVGAAVTTDRAGRAWTINGTGWDWV